ncbi:hypothetical protein DBR40_04965 [Pedobacter sp. KBW01]|uniref:hypothetical protein n=1 Tax=Pedobacter sp. KBW01 TaxID=2153364 RepID=UPI000F599096|nr:hypothetical protein [Pedobacter sp. KBW01]RQO79073.1 hypothetical protein DBR40_04965 [Pedobacter sp. KBW01]
MEDDRRTRYINRLLDVLYKWVPFSVSFRVALKELLFIQQENPKAVFLDPPDYAIRAWFSINCFIAGYSYNESGNLNVVRIYMPDNIFTDLASFFQNKPAKLKFVVIQGEELLYIKKEDFSSIKMFPETVDLVQYVMLNEQELETWRVWIMTLKDGQKIEQFALHYPMNMLPNHICASFLQMTPSRYCAEKSLYNRNHRNIDVSNFDTKNN